MAIEIEKKYRLDAESKRAVEEALAEFGAEFAGEEFEENIIYGGGALDEQHAVLRIRRTGTRSFLTYKRRQESTSGVKRQTEHETAVADPDAAAEIVEALGLVPRIVYEKRRRTFRFRNVEVVLDVLPFGEFMEIEGSLTSIGEAEMILGAEDFPVVHETYPALTANLGVRAGGRVEARFER